ncbi:MAG: carbamoyltransferase HypF [Candidatus Kariarchaeaceae archaeon]|jgi:hydrogenase maturation protein HypF
MSNLPADPWQILVTGVVQSVGFRPFIQRLAEKMEVTGFVRNLGDAGVEIVMHGSAETTKQFIDRMKNDLPELAYIAQIESNQKSIQASLTNFEIKSSLPSSGQLKGVSALPPDIAICDACLNDMEKEGSRFSYSFTSCTNCGPRYSAIEQLPYDRPFTAFSDFPLCDSCNREYTDSEDRRFHAQTTCCNKCGPKYTGYAFDQTSKTWKTIEKSWETISESIQSGDLWTIMGSGGTHFICNALDHDATSNLRKNRRKRSDKPFAVMMPSIEVIQKYCTVTEADKKLLRSKRRPIVVLPTKDPNRWDAVSPGLDTIGVMLVYNGMHRNLFKSGHLEVIVMTSANLPGIPMPVTKDNVLYAASDISSFVLVHNRTIVQRIDDSVLRSHGDYHLLIRRSRGYTPQPFFHKQFQNVPALLAVGAEESNTAALMKDGWIMPTQHLGHIINVESVEFLSEAIHHIKSLYHVNPEYVIRDLHPSFHTRSFADDYMKNHHLSSDNVMDVQHHLAHVCSLALDHQWDHEQPFLAWAGDGYGYGSDGSAWGSELILKDGAEWKRLATIRPLNYSGGDVNAKYPGRMLAYYLSAIDQNPLDILLENAKSLFRNGNVELQYISNISENGLKTTSLGRLLDSIAVLLGCVQTRGYRGEPAIKLEGLAQRSSEVSSVDPLISVHDGLPIVDNIKIFETAYDMYMNGKKSSYIARWAHETIGTSMATLGSNLADENGINHVGFTGGVAYNKLITQSLANTLKTLDKELLIHANIPPGDAGISSGQIYYTASQLLME